MKRNKRVPIKAAIGAIREIMASSAFSKCSSCLPNRIAAEPSVECPSENRKYEARKRKVFGRE